MANEITTFEERCAAAAVDAQHAPYITAAREAADPKALAKAKRAYNKASDSGETTLSAGIFLHFYDARKAELATMVVRQPTAAEARVDRILRTRNSDGRARARR